MLSYAQNIPLHKHPKEKDELWKGDKIGKTLMVVQVSPMVARRKTRKGGPDKK